MAIRDRLPRALPLLCSLFALGAIFAGGSSAQPSGDGAKISDDLETRLAGSASSDRVAVIVTLKADATAARVNALEGEVGALGSVERFSIIDGLAATVTKAQVEELSSLPIVESVEENSVVQAFNDSAQSSFGVTKARVDVPAADGGDGLTAYSPADLVAAVIDTGIDPAHLDLDDGKVLAFADCMANPCTTPAPFDDNGHGTHVAGTIAGDGEALSQYKGVAPGAALVGVKVLNAAGQGTDAGVIRGVEWAVGNKALYGIEALNLSLGDDGCSNGLDSLSVAVNNAVAARLVVAVSAGNDGPDACTIASPAAAANAITVGAMADLGQNGFHQAYFSGRGPTLDGRIKPDISAPGVGITSAKAGTTADYRTLNGTSMSSPFVAGVALLMLDVSPDLTPAQVKTHITSTAVDWGTAGADNEYGAGRLDAYAAIALAGAAITTPPVVPTHLLRQGTLSGTGAYVDYPLTVTSASTPIAATLVTSNHSSSRDFDLLLLDASNNTVASSLTSRRQDQLGYVPSAPGTYTLRVESYAGSGDYTLDLSAKIEPEAPLSTSVPTLTGTVREAEVINASTGNWTNNPNAYGYQWSRCSSAGSACVNIAGATGALTYLLASADVGFRIRVTITATNVLGWTASASSAARLVAPLPPTSIVSPTVAGTTQQGQTLTANNGTWTNSPTGYTYQWWRCNSAGGGCSTIGGATGQTHLLTTADVGGTLAVAVTASNLGGSASMTSVPSGVVTAAPAAAAAADTGGGGSGGGGTGGGGGGGGGGTDLELTGGPDRAMAAVGETFLYLFTVQVKNYAVTSGASDIVLTAQLPAEVQLLTTKVNRGPGCTGTTTVTCRLDFLSGPLTAIAELTVRVTASGPLAGSASVKGLEPDPDATNDTVSTLVNAAVPAPTQTAVRPTAPPIAAAAPKQAGTNAANTLTGTAGPDVLRGLGGDDRLFGGRGNDRLDGGRGKDVLSGGAGDDTILARDKTRDVISCGSGRDLVTADRIDVVARDCETVRRR